MIMVTISRIPATMMHENTIKALSVCLSVLTSLGFFCVFIGGRAVALGGLCG